MQKNTITKTTYLKEREKEDKPIINNQVWIMASSLSNSG